MKRLKNENGGITVIALVSVLFMVSFLVSAYIIAANKVQVQKEIIQETIRIYESEKSMEELYNSHLSQNENIAIYTNEL